MFPPFLTSINSETPIEKKTCKKLQRFGMNASGGPPGGLSEGQRRAALGTPLVGQFTIASTISPHPARFLMYNSKRAGKNEIILQAVNSSTNKSFV